MARPRAAPLPSSWSWAFVAFGAALVIATGAGLSAELAYSLLMTLGAVPVSLSLVRNRPAVAWAWWSIVAAALLWSVAGVLRDLTGTTGDLSGSRPLWPEAFALPGYALLTVALIGLLRGRRGALSLGARLDAAAIAIGGSTATWVFIVAPLLSRHDAAPAAKVAITVYPPISACLVALAALLGFAPGYRSVTHRLLLAGMAALFVGDVVYLLVETHAVESTARLVGIPYLVAAIMFGAAMLHPSIRHLGAPVSRAASALGPMRALVLALSLVVPTVFLLPAYRGHDRVVVAALALALSGVGITRLLLALRDQSSSESRLAHQANHDALTALPNRARVLDHLGELLTRTPSRSVATLFVDIDQFKLINDSMGHALGDELLVAAARRLLSVVEPDHLVGRISGDEFIVVAAGLDGTGAQALAERVRAGFAPSFALSPGEVHVSVSVGVAVADGTAGHDAIGIVRDADTAMYHAKASGRNVVAAFDTDMRDRIARRVAVERALRAALDQERLLVHFQPIVQLPAGRVLGFEALARWPASDVPVPPSEFVPIAEENGLIVPLGAWVLDQACAQVAAWRGGLPGGADLYVSVNLSARQIRESDVVDVVADTLDRHGLPGAALCLEITETVMLEDTVGTAAVLGGLRELGVGIAVDDFGTGFSSLAYLKRFPVGRLKIDRAFVGGLDRAGSDESLVAAVVAMAGALGLATVAEGVETDAQAARLVDLGCYEAQGYRFGRPAPAGQIPELVARRGLAAASAASIARPA